MDFSKVVDIILVRQSLCGDMNAVKVNVRKEVWIDGMDNLYQSNI